MTRSGSTAQGEAQGARRLAVESLLRGGGLTDDEIAARAGCSRTWVVGVRQGMGIERVSKCSIAVERIEQAIARGMDNAAAAREAGQPVELVARVRADMDAAAEEPTGRRRSA